MKAIELPSKIEKLTDEHATVLKDMSRLYWRSWFLLMAFLAIVGVIVIRFGVVGQEFGTWYVLPCLVLTPFFELCVRRLLSWKQTEQRRSRIENEIERLGFELSPRIFRKSKIIQNK